MPNFESATATDEAKITFKPVTYSGKPIENARLYVGRYERGPACGSPTTPTSDPTRPRSGPVAETNVTPEPLLGPL